MSWISDYDTSEDGMRYGLIEPDNLLKFEELIKEKKDGILLDLGIKSNRFYIEYRSKLCEQFVGLDLDKQRTMNIKKGKLYKKFNNFHYIHSDAKHIPLRDNSVDVITMLGLMGEKVLDYVTDYSNKLIEKTREEKVKKLIEDSYRVLKEDGILIISNNRESSPIISTENLLKSYFSNVQLIGGLERYLLVCRKH